MRISGKKQKNVRLILILVGAAILVLALAFTALAYTQKWWPFAQAEDLIIDGVNYGPPTEQEIESSQDAKKNILEEDKASGDGSNGNSTNLKTANVGVSHSEVIDGNLEVRAFIGNVVESGTCTATLTRTGSETVTKSSRAFVDASTSQCEPILIPVGEFDETGEWTLVVSYKSSTSAGESEKITVSI
jgi:hypothetical protein